LSCNYISSHPQQPFFKEKPVMKFEPMALAGLNLLYILTFEDSIFIKIEYGSIYEQNADIFFGLLSIGYEKRF